MTQGYAMFVVKPRRHTQPEYYFLSSNDLAGQNCLLCQEHTDVGKARRTTLAVDQEQSHAHDLALVQLERGLHGLLVVGRVLSCLTEGLSRKVVAKVCLLRLVEHLPNLQVVLSHARAHGAELLVTGVVLRWKLATLVRDHVCVPALQFRLEGVLLAGLTRVRPELLLCCHQIVLGAIHKSLEAFAAGCVWFLCGVALAQEESACARDQKSQGHNGSLHCRR